MMASLPFPQDPQEFAEDTRISFSKESKTFILEDADGDEWEWLEGPKKWSKTMDEEEVKRQAEIYKVAGVDEDEPALNPTKKRKEAQLEEPEANPKNAKANTGPGAAGAGSGKTTAPAKPPRQNSAVYVTGLPDDIDADELREFFGRYGIIAESLDDNGKRIKLYNDKDGNFTGEALIIYHRPESVLLAIEMADGAWLPRDDGLKSTQIHVSEADNSKKANKEHTVAEDRPNPKAKMAHSRALAKKKAEEMNNRLADWDDDEPSKIQQTSSRADKVVVIKGLFTLEGLKSDPDLLLDIQEDLQEGAEKLGVVKNVTVFDLEDSGVATIRFADATAARACANFWDGRGYNGNKISADISTGEEKFKKTRKNYDGEEAEKKRLEEYSKFIEGQ